MYRVEDKYLLTQMELAILEQRLSSVLDMDHAEAKQDGYVVSSLYFDDFTDRCYMDTMEGNPFRKKYRIRIYNESLNVIKLELKSKMYNRVKKETEIISRNELNELISGTWQLNDFSGHPVRNAFYMQQQTTLLRPRIIVTYNRKAFLYSGGNVRITLDYNIRGCDQVEKFASPMIHYDFPDEPYAVLEVKYDELLPDFISRLLEIGNLQQTANSKYCICRDIYNR